MRIRQSDGKGKGAKQVRNDRFIGAPVDDKRYEDVSDLSKRVRQELEQFFVSVTEMTDKKVTIDGWEGPKFAEKLIDKAAHRCVGGRTAS